MPNINANAAAVESHHFHSGNKQAGAAVPSKTTLTRVTHVANIAATNAIKEEFRTQTITRRSSSQHASSQHASPQRATETPPIRKISANAVHRHTESQVSNLNSLQKTSTCSLFFDPDCEIRLFENIQNLAIMPGSQVQRSNIPHEGVVISLVIERTNQNLTRYFSDFYNSITNKIIAAKQNIKTELYFTATNDYEWSYHIVIPDLLSKQNNNKIIFESLVQGADEFITQSDNQAKIFAAFVLSRLSQFLQRNNPENFNDRSVDNLMQKFPRVWEYEVGNSEKFLALRKEENGNLTLRRKIAMARTKPAH